MASSAEKILDKVTEETEVSPAELAATLRLTGRRVRQLTEDGVLRKAGNGKYTLIENIHRYFSWVNAKPVDEEDVRLEKARRQSEVQIKASRAMVAKLEADELKGKMHRSEDVAAMTADLILTVRSLMMALPGRLAVDTQAAKTAAEAEELIRAEVYAALEEISRYRYDPVRYEERVRNRMNWDFSEALDDG